MPEPPANVRSWQVARLGTPCEALQLVDTAPRAPGPGELTVGIGAVGLNFPDLLLCAGRYQERPELPFTPGYEAAGTVVAAGAATSTAVGTRVLVVPELPDGGMQTVLTVDESQAYEVPDAMPVTDAAVLHIAYGTAHAALHRRAQVQPGETVLITGAAGGVGTAAIQLARTAGADVIAVVTGAAKADACRAVGAGHVIDLASAADLREQVHAVTGGRGADVVLDVVGGGLFDALRRCVAFEGRLVVLGFTGGIGELPVNHLLLRTYGVLGLNLATYRRTAPHVLRDIHTDIVRMYAEGKLRPVVDAVLPFDDAPAGLDRLARRDVIGRIVLQV